MCCCRPKTPNTLKVYGRSYLILANETRGLITNKTIHSRATACTLSKRHIWFIYGSWTEAGNFTVNRDVNKNMNCYANVKCVGHKFASSLRLFFLTVIIKPYLVINYRSGQKFCKKDNHQQIIQNAHEGCSSISYNMFTKGFTGMNRHTVVFFREWNAALS